MKVTVFGSGYVGLVTGACLAEVGHEVICVDIDEHKINQLKQGQIPIYEPGLDEMVQNNSQTGRLLFTTDIAMGVEHGLLQFIAVGTPPDEDGSADLQYVLAVAKSIGEHMQDYKVIINKSTVPVGTADKVRAALSQKLEEAGKEIDFDVVSNPEFLKEGSAIDDFMKPDRIVVGVEMSHATDLMTELYAPFNQEHNRLLIMAVRSAEFTKYAANAMLATKISFMNEMANMAEKVGVDIEEVRHGISLDARIGKHFLYPGSGYGGSCFPKDVKALERIAQNQEEDGWMLHAVEAVNKAQKRILFQKINRYFKGDLKNKVFALWGLAFKPETDDMREAPSRILLEALWTAGAKVRAYDPAAMIETRRIYGERDDLLLCDNKESAINGVDALIVQTEWSEFKNPDFAVLKNQLKQALIFDGRNIYDPKALAQDGFIYYGIGRGASIQRESGAS